jgi:hypothetical protein
MGIVLGLSSSMSAGAAATSTGLDEESPKPVRRNGTNTAEFQRSGPLNTITIAFKSG